MVIPNGVGSAPSNPRADVVQICLRYVLIDMLTIRSLA